MTDVMPAPAVRTAKPASAGALTRAENWFVSLLTFVAGGAIVAMLLAIPIVTQRTKEQGNTLGISHQWWLLGVMALVGAIIAALLWRLERTRAAGNSRAKSAASSAAFTQIGGFVGPALLLFAIVMPFIPGFNNRYWVDIGTLVITYIMLGWGLNIVVGLAGLLDLGYVAFYAVGAYSFAILALTFELSFWTCLPLAGLLAALWGVILGFPVLRLRGDYLAIVTLAFGEIIRVVLINWQGLTGGPAGLNNIPRPSFFGLPFADEKGSFSDFFGLEYASIQRIIYLYYIVLLLALVTHFVSTRLRRLPIGRAWEALREDEIACRSLGINTVNTKLTAFAIGAMFGGFAGAFFATRQGFISPESFNFMESATILAIVVLGGMGSQIGVVVASIVMVVGIELLRELGFLKQLFGPEFDPTLYRMLIFGLALVAIMIWRPRGIVSSRTPTATLGAGKAKTIGSDMVKEGHG